MARILVAYKKTRWDQYFSDSSFDPDEAFGRDTSNREQLRASHEAHSSTLGEVLDYLAGTEHAVHSAYRGDLAEEEVADYDLVISVGGDGTVLDLSHRVFDVPVLGINSDPSASIGWFCAGDASSLPRLLQAFEEDRCDQLELNRVGASINGNLCPYPVLNDLLVAHENPAAVSHYLLRTNDGEEEQRSSGVWISTAAGSTAAIRSAGGTILPLESSVLQYLVREPVPREPALTLTKGVFSEVSAFEIISRMPGGRVYLDGPHESVELGIGDTLMIHHDFPPLKLLGLKRRRLAREI